MKQDLAPIFTEEEFRHWFIPRKGIIDSYVVEVVYIVIFWFYNAWIFIQITCVNILSLTVFWIFDSFFLTFRHFLYNCIYLKSCWACLLIKENKSRYCDYYDINIVNVVVVCLQSLFCKDKHLHMSSCYHCTVWVTAQ